MLRPDASRLEIELRLTAYNDGEYYRAHAIAPGRRW